LQKERESKGADLPVAFFHDPRSGIQCPENNRLSHQKLTGIPYNFIEFSSSELRPFHNMLK